MEEASVESEGGFDGTGVVGEEVGAEPPGASGVEDLGLGELAEAERRRGSGRSRWP